MAKVGPFGEQVSTDLLRKVSEVAARVEIRDIRLVKIAASLSDPLPESGQTIAVELDHGVKADVIDSSTLLAQVRFTLAAKASIEAEKPFVEIGATFQLLYQGENIGDIPHQSWSSFASVNAVHNAWPYLRELVQSISSRMSVPPLTVPLLKVQPAKTRQEQKKSD